MRILACLVLLLAGAGVAPAAVTSAPGGLQDALAARALLGDRVWARPLRIDNNGRKGALRRSEYPRTVYALAFELSGILWFYTDTNGTQSLSLTLGTLERDKADPGPLIRAIDPGFASWSWMDDPPGAWGATTRDPPNACFVKSIAALFRRMDAGSEAESPQLLSYYAAVPKVRGHTVLLFRTRDGLSAIDADASEKPISLPAFLGSNLRSIAAFLRGGPVAATSTLPIRYQGKLPAPSQFAAVPSRPTPAG
jgi:hypothetical protein